MQNKCCGSATTAPGNKLIRLRLLPCHGKMLYSKWTKIAIIFKSILPTVVKWILFLAIVNWKIKKVFWNMLNPNMFQNKIRSRVCVTRGKLTLFPCTVSCIKKITLQACIPVSYDAIFKICTVRKCWLNINRECRSHTVSCCYHGSATVSQVVSSKSVFVNLHVFRELSKISKKQYWTKIHEEKPH
jgi:hypothetical protein